MVCLEQILSFVPFVIPFKGIPLTNNPFINGIGNDADFAQNLTRAIEEAGHTAQVIRSQR